MFSTVSSYWQLLQLRRPTYFTISHVQMSFKMPSGPKFWTDDSVKISRGADHLRQHTEIPWPARSPDQAPCDLWLWSVCEAEVRRVKPKTLEDLMEVVSDFVASLDPAEVRRAVRNVRPRAELCIKMDGGYFESNLKKYKQGRVEEWKYLVRLILLSYRHLCFVWKLDIY